MAKETAGTVIAVVSDTHIGSYSALSLPTWVLAGKPGEEVPYEANLAGKWIYDRWIDYWDYVKSLAGVVGRNRKHRIVVLHLGDIVDGIHHNTIQSLINPEDQISMASEIMTQVSNIADGGLFCCMGTEAHSGANGSNERAVMHNAGAKKIDQELLLDIDGLIILAYHHGRAGARAWTSSAASVAVEAQLTALQTEQPVPNLVLCGHNHRIDDSGAKLPTTRAISLPSWQLKTSFGYRVASGQRSDIGGIVIHPGGLVDFSRARYMAAPGQRGLLKV